jgi:hypothetical protein
VNRERYGRKTRRPAIQFLLEDLGHLFWVVGEHPAAPGTQDQVALSEVSSRRVNTSDAERENAVDQASIEGLHGRQIGGRDCQDAGAIGAHQDVLRLIPEELDPGAPDGVIRVERVATSFIGSIIQGPTFQEARARLSS